MEQEKQQLKVVSLQPVDQLFLSRPKNDFIDVQLELLQKQEKMKQQLAQDLRAQIEEKARLKQQAKEKELKEMQDFERKWQKELQAMKEQQESAKNNKCKERALKEQRSLPALEVQKKVNQKRNFYEDSVYKDVKIERKDTPVTIIGHKSLKRSNPAPVKHTKSFFITQDDLNSQTTSYPTEPQIVNGKSELNKLVKAVEVTQNQLKSQVELVLIREEQVEQLKKQKLDEIKVLKQQILDSRAEYQNKELEFQQRAIHQRNSYSKLESLSPEKERIKLKQILIHDYVQGVSNRKYSQIVIKPKLTDLLRKRSTETVVQSDHGFVNDTLDSSFMYNVREIRNKNLRRLLIPDKSIPPYQSKPNAFTTIDNQTKTHSIHQELIELLQTKKHASIAVRDSTINSTILDELY